jgi:hypothetical protein
MNTRAGNQTGALIVALALGISAHAAPPSAPQVAVGADVKQLTFDWDIVPRSNYYEVWFKANDGAPYVKLFENRPWDPHDVNNVSAHLLDWDQARYQVKACNPSGCSASPPLAVHDHMLESIGYFKADRTAANANFGIVSAISEDGQTLATFVRHAGGVDDAPSSVYLFAKVDGHWRQQQQVEPFVAVSGHYNFGLSNHLDAALSLSADGNTLMAVMPMRS